MFAAQGNNIPTARIKSVVEIFGHDNDNGDDEDGNCVIVNNGGSGGTESCNCPAGPAGSDGLDGLAGPAGPVGPAGPAGPPGPAAASSGEGVSEG